MVDPPLTVPLANRGRTGHWGQTAFYLSDLRVFPSSSVPLSRLCLSRQVALLQLPFELALGEVNPDICRVKVKPARECSMMMTKTACTASWAKGEGQLMSK